MARDHLMLRMVLEVCNGQFRDVLDSLPSKRTCHMAYLPDMAWGIIGVGMFRSAS